MGQQKNTSLKAYVRFDGTGRIVPSSLILQRFKPKDGNWKQINATECCSNTTTTTSSTTTLPPSYSTFINYSTTSGPEACYQAQDQFTVYTSSPIGQGVVMYIDAALTSPAPTGFYSANGLIYNSLDGLITGIDPCPPSNAYSYVISQTDLDLAIDNTNATLNGKVITETSDDGSGNPATRSFTSPGSYNHWMCSLNSITPTFGYWASDVFVTVGLVSEQSNIGAC